MNLVSSSQKVLVRKQDPVTGLMGVRAFYQTALNLSLEKKAQGRLKSYNPVYLNLTNFKLYNATWEIQAGDNLLRSVASILQSLFPGQLMTRLTGDGFVLLAPAEKLRDKLQEAARQVDQCTGNPTIQLKAGIYPPNEKASLTDLRHAFDMAKFACDSIKKNAIQSWAVYTPELATQQETRAFVAGSVCTEPGRQTAPGTAAEPPAHDPHFRELLPGGFPGHRPLPAGGKSGTEIRAPAELPVH